MHQQRELHCKFLYCIAGDSAKNAGKSEKMQANEFKRCPFGGLGYTKSYFTLFEKIPTPSIYLGMGGAFPLTSGSRIFLLKTWKKAGLVCKSGNGWWFYSTPSGSLQKPEYLCYNNMTPSGSGRDMVLQDPGEGKCDLSQSIWIITIHADDRNSFRLLQFIQTYAVTPTGSNIYRKLD